MEGTAANYCIHYTKQPYQNIPPLMLLWIKGQRISPKGRWMKKYHGLSIKIIVVTLEIHAATYCCVFDVI